MSGSASEAHVPARDPAVRADSMAGTSGDAVMPGATAGAVQAGPPARGDAGPVLPRRIAITVHTVPAGTIWPPADPELLRRVLDGLRQL